MWYWPSNCIQQTNWHRGTIEALHHLRSFSLTARVRTDKYYDYENDVYLLDKMPAISPLSWDDLLEPEQNLTELYFVSRGERGRKNPYIERQKWFTPKDDDFDEECRRDEEAKRLAAERAEKEEKAEKEEQQQKIGSRVIIPVPINNKWVPK